MKNGIPGRFLVAAGMFLLALLLYIDRICISVAKEPVAEALSLNDKQMGWVLSAFALGYALFQVPTGRLSDKFGPRITLTSIVTIWSAFTMLTGAAWNYVSLIVIRFLFGTGEAGAFPGMSRAIYSWIPAKERGTVLGINFSGGRLGGAFALPLVAWMIESYGWRSSFLILGFVGVLWAIIWWFTFRDKPEDHPRISEEEKSFILTHRQQSSGESSSSIPFQSMLASKNMWLIIGQYFASNFTFFFALTWLFPHLKETYNLASVEAGWYAVAPLICGAIGNWVSGWLVDRLYRSGKWNLSRTLPAIIGFALAAIGMIGSLYMDTAMGAIILLSIAIFGADMSLAPSWALCVDIGKEHSGVISGTMNMAGNIGSFVTALAFPYLTAWSGSVNVFFYTAAVLNIIAVLLWVQVRADRGLN